jgi:hypothetical protein
MPIRLLKITRDRYEFFAMVFTRSISIAFISLLFVTIVFGLFSLFSGIPLLAELVAWIAIAFSVCGLFALAALPISMLVVLFCYY